MIVLGFVLLWIIGGLGTLLLFKHTNLKCDTDEHLLASIFWPVYSVIVFMKIISDLISNLNDTVSDWINH
jgi:hypothetical protein